MPVPVSWLAAAGLGRDRLGQVLMRARVLLARTERVYAGTVIDVREEPPAGEIAQQAIRDLILSGKLFAKLGPQLRRRHATAGLAAQLSDAPPLAALPEWLLARLAELGLEDADDLALLEPEDLLPAAPPEPLSSQIVRRFPLDLSIGDATYRVAYDVSRRIATLHQVSGQRKTPPPDRYLPSLQGWKLMWEHKNRVRTLRER
jgi:hypothetical protein